MKSVLVPTRGWSAADKNGEPLFDPDMNRLFLRIFKDKLDLNIKIQEVDYHINEDAFGHAAARLMDEMVREVTA